MLRQIPQRVTIFPSDLFFLNENFPKGYLGYASRETAPALGSSPLSDQPPGGWTRKVSTITYREQGRVPWVTNPQVGGRGRWAPSLTMNRVEPPEWPTPRWVDEEGEHHHSPWTGSSPLSDQPPGGWTRKVSTITHREQLLQGDEHCVLPGWVRPRHPDGAMGGRWGFLKRRRMQSKFHISSCYLKATLLSRRTKTVEKQQHGDSNMKCGGHIQELVLLLQFLSCHFPWWTQHAQTHKIISKEHEAFTH